jgi:hypothetical protein
MEAAADKESIRAVRDAMDVFPAKGWPREQGIHDYREGVVAAHWYATRPCSCHAGTLLWCSVSLMCIQGLPPVAQHFLATCLTFRIEFLSNESPIECRTCGSSVSPGAFLSQSVQQNLMPWGASPSSNNRIPHLPVLV